MFYARPDTEFHKSCSLRPFERSQQTPVIGREIDLLRYDWLDLLDQI